MVKYDRNNEFSFGVKYNVPSAVLLEAEGNLFKSCITAVATDVENEIILRTLLDIAKKNGITDLIVLDEEKIKTVFEKQIPQKPIYIDVGYELPLCPCCAASMEKADKDNYCSVCGQAIYWNEEKRLVL